MDFDFEREKVISVGYSRPVVFGGYIYSGLSLKYETHCSDFFLVWFVFIYSSLCSENSPVPFQRETSLRDLTVSRQNRYITECQNRSSHSFWCFSKTNSNQKVHELNMVKLYPNSSWMMYHSSKNYSAYTWISISSSNTSSNPKILQYPIAFNKNILYLHQLLQLSLNIPSNATPPQTPLFTL